MSKPGSGYLLRVTICLTVLLSFLMIRPPGADAFHAPLTGLDSNCAVCHTLDAAEGDANTSYISSSARTFPLIKAYDGLASNQTPQYLGCTFCHYMNDANTSMRPVLNHFQGKLSFHPVGYNFNTRTETNNEFVSGYGQTQGLVTVPVDPSAIPTANQLDCVDCHDIDLGGGYPQHDTPPVNNPFMLRNITGLGEYDGLCRTCHRSDAPVTVKTVSMQLTKHADGAAGRPLLEDDGTVLRTNDLDQDGVADAAGIVDQCRVCHDSHYSSKYKLFNDGKEMHKVGAGEVPDVAITSANCTEVCHYPGDYNNLPAGNYGTYGHGKAESTYRYRNGRPDWTGTTRTMGLACTGCHVSLDIGTKPHVEPTPSGANDRERYKNRFNLNINLQATDAGSVYGNPIWGVCLQCHSGYVEHRGGGVTIGCQDCHDEHGEGSGSTSNVFMIPEQSKDDGFFLPFGTGTHARTKAAAEAVTYDSTRLHFDGTTSYVARSIQRGLLPRGRRRGLRQHGVPRRHRSGAARDRHSRRDPRRQQRRGAGCRQRLRGLPPAQRRRRRRLARDRLLLRVPLLPREGPGERRPPAQHGTQPARQRHGGRGLRFRLHDLSLRLHAQREQLHQRRDLEQRRHRAERRHPLRPGDQPGESDLRRRERLDADGHRDRRDRPVRRPLLPRQQPDLAGCRQRGQLGGRERDALLEPGARRAATPATRRRRRRRRRTTPTART